MIGKGIVQILFYQTASTNDDPFHFVHLSFVRGDESVGFEQQLLPDGIGPSSDVIEIDDEEKLVNGLDIDCSLEKLVDNHIEVENKEDKVLDNMVKEGKGAYAGNDSNESTVAYHSTINHELGIHSCCNSEIPHPFQIQIIQTIQSR